MGTLQPQDQPKSGLPADQASVNQATFWPVLNISMAVFQTDAAYQFDTSYACQAHEVTGDNSPSLVIMKILKLS